MTSHHGSDWETQVQNTARHLVYPPTPDIVGDMADQLALQRSGQVRWRLAWAVLALLIVLAALMAVPEVRAKVLKFLQIGSVKIEVDEEAPPPDVTLPPLIIPGRPGEKLAGQTTLEEARTKVNFPIKLPTYPTDLGRPDEVYVQYWRGYFVVLIWVSEDDPSRARISLQILGPGVEASKGDVKLLEETTVNGEWAVWLTGQHILQFEPGELELGYLVDGHILLWDDGDLTYRLETDLPLDEARKIAESLE